MQDWNLISLLEVLLFGNRLCEFLCPAGEVRDSGAIPLGRSPEGHGNPLQYSCLENNPIDKGAWQATLHGIAESDTIEAT